MTSTSLPEQVETVSLEEPEEIEEPSEEGE